MAATATPASKTKQISRAVTRRVEAGSGVVCAQCGQAVKFAAKVQRQQVIANVYVDGRWHRVEHFHAECYDEAGQPYGESSVSAEAGRR